MRADTVIVTHGNTDFDAFASQLAARRLYPGSVIALQGSLNRNVRELVRLHADELDAVEASRLELDAIKRLVVVETVHSPRLGELETVALDPDVETVVFDHHTGALPSWVDPETAVVSHDGALTTTMVGILAERELEPTPLEATVFALGIHEDTGSLTYLTATQRDADALAWCMRHGASQELVLEYLHAPLSASERGLLHALEESIEAIDAGGEELLLASLSWPEYVDGVSNLAHKLVDLTDCRALVVLVEMEERVVAVARSRSERIDAAALAAALDGGGHEGAASALTRIPLEDARARVLAAIPDALREPRRARDVMSTPVRSVAPDDTVSRAMAMCQRHGQSGVFVADDDGRLVGGVRREDLDKAIGHGLAHAPVKAVMSGRLTTCGEETTLAELQRLVTIAEDGRVAVVRDGRIVGVVSRRDLLRALEGLPGARLEPTVSLAAELRDVEALAPVFDAVAELGDRAEGVYLVGGTVRDILLGEDGFDVDIAVEGDAIAFARDLARAFGGRFTPHEKFGTAVVSYAGGRVDVVTTRTEFYDAPAALPTVERAGLQEDLFRRDFTINAMAASLKLEDFGRLVDPFGGRPDLAAGTIRVLHNLSFIDDPTRIFRAVRYEARYGFTLDEHSLRLARGCVEMGLVGDLSSARLRDELVALLEEPAVPRALVRLGELGADRAVHPHLSADDVAAELLTRALRLRDDLQVDVPVWRLGIAVLAREMESDEALAWLARLKVRRRDAEQIAGAIAVAPRIVDRLREERLSPAEVVALADPYGPDAPLLALAHDESLDALRDYFGRLRDVRLEITGSDLAELGLAESPQVGEVLTELRRRKLNGEIAGFEAELSAARELLAENTS